MSTGYRGGNKEYWLGMAAFDYAEAVARASKCERAQVGCVLTTPELNIVSFGYNGTGRGMPAGCIRHGQEAIGRCGCIHAESNAIAKAHHDGPMIAFITIPPCEHCAQLLVNGGVRAIFWANEPHRSRPEESNLPGLLSHMKVMAGDKSTYCDIMIPRLRSKLTIGSEQW